MTQPMTDEERCDEIMDVLDGLPWWKMIDDKTDVDVANGVAATLAAHILSALRAARAEATLAERERAAKVAESDAKDCGLMAAVAHRAGQKMLANEARAARRIAAAIRTGERRFA